MIGSAASQNGFLAGRARAASSFAAAMAGGFLLSNASSSSPPSTCASSSSSSCATADARATSDPSAVAIGDVPTMLFVDGHATCAFAAAAAAAAAASEDFRRKLFFPVSPNENECDASIRAAAPSSPPPSTPLTLVPAVASKLTPSIASTISPRTRASAPALCAVSPSTGFTSYRVASASILCEPNTSVFGTSFRAIGSVSTNRQSSGNSR